MTDYSDIIYLMGAMVIVSMLSLNVSHFIRVNEQYQYQSEIQYNGIAVAQDIIEEIRWISDKERFKTDSGKCLCDEYPKTVTKTFGTTSDYNLDYNVNLDISDINISGSNATNKLIVVRVTNEYLKDQQFVEMEYIKSFVE